MYVRTHKHPHEHARLRSSCTHHRVRNIINNPAPNLDMGPSQHTNKDTVLAHFKWAHGGSRVFLTGSFNKWQGKLMMSRCEDEPCEFELLIDIPPGTYACSWYVVSSLCCVPHARLHSIAPPQARSCPLPLGCSLQSRGTSADSYGWSCGQAAYT